ncbi:MAG TPA: neuraminidase-like domain-containing protein [Blastocatellia bacterium]|nr:neuraminidase-like domain-containing protein [Blastocatellia bacterium]
MQAITAPISRDEPRDNRAAIIVNLQKALLLLLRGGAIPGGRERQQFFEEGLEREQREQVYGDITQKLVTMFQEQFRQRFEVIQPFFLLVTGNVDDATAAVMNQLLVEMDALRSVEGRVTNQDGNPVVGNLLFAFDKENIGGAFLGAANSNADGHYQISYDPSFYAQAGEGVLKIKEIIDLIVQVYDADGATLAESIPLHNPGRKVRVNLRVGDMPAGQSFTLRGQVFDAKGPINGIQVSVFDRDLFFRRDGANNGQHLGTEITRNSLARNEDGRFEITYRTSDFVGGDNLREGDIVPDLIFALSEDGQPQEKFQIFRLPDGRELIEEAEVSDDDLILGIQARRVEDVRILISRGDPKPEMSEYERLWRAIEPLLPERAPEDADDSQRENLVCAAATLFDEEKHRDISFVRRETGLDSLLIQKFAAACRLAVDPFQNLLPASVFYALARMRGVSDLLTLALLSTDDLRLALRQATEDAPPLIPAFNPSERLEAALQTIRDVIASQLPTHRLAEGEPSLADLVGAELPDPDQQTTLWRTYSEHDGTTAEFWQKLEAQPGFNDPNKIARVQYSFQLGLLSQNNISLVNAIRDELPGVADMGELAFRLDSQEKWIALLDKAGVPIPAGVPGPPEESKANYAASLTGALQIAHPTAAVANLVASLPPTQFAEAQPGVATFLIGAVRQAKFDLATGHIDDLVAQHGDDLLAEVDLKDRPVVIDQVKRVQRLFRLSSGPQSMKVLLDAGIDSARDLAELPPDVAMEMLKPALGETSARLMLNRASSISSETIHKFVLVNDEINGQIPQALKRSEAPEEMGDVATRRGPDYASLFGSVELCDCQHCRSIHSPAAYLVALLQFLGPKIPAVTPLDILIGNVEKRITGRRPDIAHILLSCENTNTTLPYVDLVNEVMESYIVFSQTLPLETDEAGVELVPPVPEPNESSPGVTAAELAANPENTRDGAYEALEAAVYPFTLPFNQPVAALRLTLEEMGSSRHEVMDLFRHDDGEAATRALDVEALKLTEREFAILTGEQFDALPAVRPVPDFYGFDAPVEPNDTVWVLGSLPQGAQQHVDKDSWTFAAFDPAPPSGATAHASAPAAGLHQHYFDKATGPGKLKVGAEDFLFAEIFLDAGNLPQEVMLQWNDGTWEHRAYWGLSKIAVGVEGTASLRYMGPLPSAGEWVRLEVPAYFVGVAGKELSGTAFTLFGGGATWGAAGKRSPSWIERLAHVPILLSRTGLTYVELVELLRMRYINPALPQGEVLTDFERIPVSYSVLAILVASNFTDPDAKTLKALDGAGMTLEELEAWAAEHFEPLGKLMVLDAPDSACDLALTRLQHLDGTDLDEADLSRLHRFIRLWRKLGWSAQDLDRAVVALQADEITPTFLRHLGQVVQLQVILKLSPQELLSFWGAIPTAGTDALYHKLFLNKAVREIDPDFAPVDAQYLPALLDLKIKDHIPALLAGLRTRAADLDLIREHTTWTVSAAPTTFAALAADDAPLTLATTTTLYRYVKLARALKVSVKDLIYLQSLSGERPFSTLSDSNTGFTDIDPARTLRFVRLTERLKQSGFTPASLIYLFNELAVAPASLAPGDASISLSLGIIREGLMRIGIENEAVDDPTGEVTRARLGLLFEAHMVEQIVGLIAGTQVYAAPLPERPGALPVAKVNYDETSHLLKAAGWLSDADRDALLALPDIGGLHGAVKTLYEQPRDLLKQTLAKQLGWTKVETDLKASVLEAPSLGTDGTIEPALVAVKFKAFLAESLPYIRTALSRAFVKQTLADSLKLEPAATSLLLEGAPDGVLLGADAKKEVPAIADFLSLLGDGLKGTYFENETLTEPSLESRVDPTIDFRWGEKHGFSVQWRGKVLADKTQRYQFHLRAGGSVQFSVGGTLLIDRREVAAPAEYMAATELEAGKLYDLEIKYSNHRALSLMELRWSGPATPTEIVPSYRLYSDAEALKAAEHTYIRLHKASALVKGFKLTPHEIAFLAQPKQSDGNLPHPNALDLNELPVDNAFPDQHALFAAWSRWNDYAALRSVATRDTTSLLDCIIASTANEAQAALARATGWDGGALAALAGSKGFDLKDADYKNTATLVKVANAMRLLGRLGTPVLETFGWATPAPEIKQARDAAQEAKRAHKAQYDNESWLVIARSISDRLRESQRAALVAYLLPRLDFTDSNQLFGHFLIDVEMSPCMLTSRIKQAISSVQLFVQRCRMNLEPNVAPKMIDSARWQWIQNYRVWEANLKIFLYPENWIEPELRDDKSPFFREMESELLQDEVTTENAELALAHYLEKIGTVSQLKICGMCEQTDFASDEKRESVLHVFGHTFANPRVFYYRQLVRVNSNYRYWTAWEKVPLDIHNPVAEARTEPPRDLEMVFGGGREAYQVLPVIWNRRLYLFWPVISDKKVGNVKGHMLRIAWSEYRHGKWSAKQVSAVDQALTLMADPLVFRMSAEATGGGELTIVFGTPADEFPASVVYGTLTFQNYNGLVLAEKPKSNKTVTYRAGFLPSEVNKAFEFQAADGTDMSVPLFRSISTTGGIRLLAANSRPYTLNDSFFLQEGPRSYLVTPHSFVQSDLERRLSTEAIPYLPSLKAKAKTFEIEKAPGAPLQAQLSKLSTVANPWLASRAGIAAMEMRALSAPAPDGVVKAVKDFSLDSQIFHHGVIELSPPLMALYAAEFRFETFFHPYAHEFQKRLNRYGVTGLLNINSQQPDGLPKLPSFTEAYLPERTVKTPLPAHNVDFDFTGAYSLYNWEIFFHAPLLLATRLSQNQRFEESMRWFQFIFDPTAATPDEPAPQRFWNVLPLRNAQPLRLDDMLKALNAGNSAMIAQWEDLQAHPFQPHRIARMRHIAYQKTVVMKYIDNLIAWGDQLFRRDTIETINQATQLYVMAADLLGQAPQRLPARGRSQAKTYAQLRSGGIDKFNQAMVLFENDLPFSSHATTGDNSTEMTGLLGIGRSFYFCIPKNEKLLGYWDTVADRLFKIRHCMNIEGVVRELALFEPPIDPALLVSAAAQGIDLSSVLNDLSAPLPSYRFGALLGKALELTGELRSLGAALLGALEKRDAEHLANLRASHENELLSLVKQVKQQQVTEAGTAAEGLEKSREVIQTRFDFYNNIVNRISEETNQLMELAAAQDFQKEGQSAESTASDIATYSPDFGAGVILDPMGPPKITVSATVGRGNVVSHFKAVSGEKNFEASLHTYHASRSSILGGWNRRAEDWRLQKDLAFKELAQMDKQIAAAHIRVAIAERDLENTSRQIEQSEEIQEFLRNKYTGEELYSWMQGEISTVYFQCYQMAYDLAKKAERCYRFERGLNSSNFIRFGVWDSLRKGLLSGERLHLQLKQMERAFMEGNRREYELTKHYSLMLNDPEALISLKGSGQCEIELPEALFDTDYPGHYMRRVKNVSLTIPAVVGPYTSVNCTLALLRDKTRIKATPADGYAERGGEEDDRFVTNWAPLQAIATSTGQNDAGLFELNFRDERYLPFEGAGMISRWRIVLDQDANGFDFNTLSDVVLHIRYTAREGGERLRQAAKAALEQALGEEAAKPLARMFSLKHEFPTEWHKFTHPAQAAAGTFRLDKERFPFLFRGKSKTLTVGKVHLYAVLRDGAEPEAPLRVVLTPPGGDDARIEFELRKRWRNILAPKNAPNVETEITATAADSKWSLKTISGDLAKNVDDLLLVCEYRVELRG